MELSDRQLRELIAKLLISHCIDGALVLPGLEIGPRGAHFLAQALKGTSVHTLDLCGHDIGAMGARALAQVLKETSLHTLDLSLNQIGDEGAIALAEGLKGTSVRTLRLWSNNIKAEGAEALAQALHKTSVHSLDLSTNPIGDGGGIAFALALKQTLVHTLSLSNNLIGREVVQVLAQALKGSQVTGFYPGWIDFTIADILKQNLSAKKGTMIALWQLASKGKFYPDLVNLIASFLPEACEPNHERAIATIEASIEASHEFPRNKAAAQVIQRAWARHRLFRQPTTMDTEHAITATDVAPSRTSMFHCAVM